MSAADGTIVGTTKIVDSGPDAVRWNLVLIAEGYTTVELTQFASDAQSLVNRLRATPPFDTARCGINVHRVDVASNESGADDPTSCGGAGTTPATYFDASFCNSGIQRLLLVDGALALSVANAQVPAWHQVLVIVNSPIWGGAGGSIGTTSTAAGWENIALHEMGHSAFGLADEYDFFQSCAVDTTQDNYGGPEPIEPNVTTSTDRATLKWRDLILPATPLPSTSNADCTVCDPQLNPVAADTVGTFEGARYFHCGLHRPQFDCMMNNLQPFCAVCSREVRRTLAPFLPGCLAPVFQGSSGMRCLRRLLFLVVVLVGHIFLIWRPGGSCSFKQTLFRIRNCRSGNADPCIPL